MINGKGILLVLLLAVIARVASGQACSCAGAPVVGSLELPSTPSGTWQIGLSYEYSLISRVYSGTRFLRDDSRERSVHSGLLEISHGISDRFSVSFLFSALQQERNSGSGEGTGNFLTTRGVGDAVALIKYNVLSFSIHSKRQISVGGGVKLPIGRASLLTDGVLASADMQPGTGAWDGVVTAYVYQGFQPKAPLGWFGSLSYRFTGTNDRFGEGREGYRFGNELTLSSGFNYASAIPLGFSLALKYRNVDPNRFNNFEIPNTGGRWLNLVPGLDLVIGKSWSISTSSQIPLYRDLSGTQLTTSYTLSLSINYTFSKTRSTWEI
jgi:hypothetical protein